MFARRGILSAVIAMAAVNAAQMVPEADAFQEPPPESRKNKERRSGQKQQHTHAREIARKARQAARRAAVGQGPA